MGKEFMDAVESRRSAYAIGKEVLLSEEKIEELVHRAVLHAPSAFHSQSARVVILLGEEHEKLWGITEKVLRKIVPEESFADTKAKLDSFSAGYGTILYFEEQNTVRTLQENYPLYQENFPIWSLESAGMLQYIIWTALEAEGLGASLQHYNPLIDDAVHESWNLPKGWKLLAEMPFGSINAPAKPKANLPIEQRVLTFS